MVVLVRLKEGRRSRQFSLAQAVSAFCMTVAMLKPDALGLDVSR
jgi:hypothetical protein